MAPNSINDQRMMVKDLEQTNRVSIEYSMITEWIGMRFNAVCRSRVGITD